jgi:hypothetical protein
MKRLWPGGAVAALAMLCLVLGGMLIRASGERERQSSRNADLQRQFDLLQARSAISGSQADSLRALFTAVGGSPIHGLYIRGLRDQGLANPVRDLIADLQHHPEVIPHPGVSGGRMGFYDPDRIRVLNDSWVYAPFEDGHVAGDAILGYRVAPGGRISWRVVVSRLE